MWILYRTFVFYSLHPHEMFLNFFMWDNYIYSLYPHRIFLNLHSHEITIYTTYTHMKCFLTFLYEIAIYSLKPHEMFLNFSMWNIKTSKYFLNFLPGWPVLTRVTRMTWTRPLGRVNPQSRFNNYGVHTVILMWIYTMKCSFCYF